MQARKTKVAALTAIVVLAGIITLFLGICLLTRSRTIPARTLETRPSVAKSEIRALFVHSFSMINPDWESITQTAKGYGIQKIVIEAMGNNYVHYPSDYAPWAHVVLPDALVAAHARDIELHVSMNVLLSSPGEGYQVVAADGTKRDWLDPTNPHSKTLLKNLVEEVTANYDIDGFMFDYVRYASADVPYGEYARQSLEQYLGETVPNFPGDFAPEGSRYNEFMEWRVHVIDDLVRDMRNWMLAIKPDLEFSAAVWGWEPEWPTYNRYWIGQDSVYWVKEGYLDWVAPMMYTADLNRIAAFIQDYQEHMVAGPEGKIPLVAFLSNTYPDIVAPDRFKQQIDTVRAYGADGWIIWRYGGPGDGKGSGAPDIRDYLSIIDIPDVFSLKDIKVSPSSKSATITWTTDNPATSEVEYSTSPLFTATFVYDSRVDFSYWDVAHVAGTIVKDPKPVVDHSITLTGLQKGTIYYLRVQSQDASSIATSKVCAFEF